MTRHWRPTIQPQGLIGMGGMGGSMRSLGKSGPTFDHVFSRLQNELQKSRETGPELHSLNGSMVEIHEVLGGTKDLGVKLRDLLLGHTLRLRSLLQTILPRLIHHCRI